MDTVRISSKHQVVIPKHIRDTLTLQPGQRLGVVLVDGRIEMVPVPSIEQARGFLRGIETSVPRDDGRP